MSSGNMKCFNKYAYLIEFLFLKNETYFCQPKGLKKLDLERLYVFLKPLDFQTSTTLTQGNKHRFPNAPNSGNQS